MNVRIAVMLAFAYATLIGPTAFAADTNAANTLKITPVRTDIEVKPGESFTVKATVSNLTGGPISVRPIQNDFVAGDENGTPALILDANEFAPTHSLKRFMQPLADTTIPAGQAKTISVVIKVPADAMPGGYFGAVRFAPTSPDDGGQVNLSASVASLILLSVPGDAVEKLNLTDFDIRQGNSSGTNFRSANDLSVFTRFENKGSVQLGPLGRITVTQGDKIIYETDFNNKDQRDMVLPNSARRWDIPLKNIGSFGKYNVTATYTYGTKNQTIEITRSFWVVPTGVIIASVAGVLTLIGLIVGIWLFLRSYKRKILRSSNSGFRR